MTHLPTVDQRIVATLSEDAGRIPVVLGLCGSGRTSLLQRLHAEFGPGDSQYVNVERTATTPERFLAALTAASPFVEARPVPSSPREAFDAILAFFSNARRADQGPVTFLLDEVLEFRTFESFPGLRRALPELLAVIASSSNRFVLTSRYVTRTERALASASPQFVVVPIGGIPDHELARQLSDRLGLPPGDESAAASDGSAAGLANLIGRLTDGRAAYACAIVDAMAACAQPVPDPVAALAAVFQANARLSSVCEYTYELRLHRARGYGALKAILEILSGQEPLTLTEISQRLGRTPGSTKDYLSWLEDVDLISVQQKRYRFRDSMLRMWVRLNCRPVPPTPEDIGREVQAHASACLASPVEV